MPVVIDGNNLLHSLPGRGRSRDEVRRQVLEAVRGESLRLTVVFDGPPPAGTPETECLGSVTVRYSGARSADDLIVALIPAGGTASQWVVVSDDRGLRERVLRRGGAVRSVVEWRGRRPRRRQLCEAERRLSARELAEWEAYFAGGADPEER
jgi:hypothetical protein